MKRLEVYQVTLLLTFFLASSITAPAQTAQVTGRISDASGAVVPDARVTLTNQANGFRRDTVTNEEGYYTVPLLQPGSYEISVRKDGYRPLLRSGVALNVEQVARLDFALETSAVTDTMTITSDAALLGTSPL